MNIIEVLKKRFFENMARHENINWETIEARLKANSNAVKSLEWMEETGGEPDVIGMEGEQILFADCARESPIGRRSLCYDEAALRARKKNPPVSSAQAQAEDHGICLMTYKQYLFLQSLGEFDLKTSSWIYTPEDIRNLGGALFCEKRYNTVFVFHNGADSYYGVRGFRGVFYL